MRLLVAIFLASAAAQTVGDPPPPLVWEKLKGNCPARLDWASLRSQKVELSYGDENVVADEVLEWQASDPKALYLRVQGGSEFLLDQALKLSGYRGCVLYDPKSLNPGKREWSGLQLDRAMGRVGGPPRRFTHWDSPEGIRLALISVIARSWDVPRSRVLFAEKIDVNPEGRNPVDFTRANDKLSLSEIQSLFHVVIEPQTLDRQVYVLTGAGVSSQLQRAKTNEPSMADALGGSIIGASRTMSDIARSLEPELEAAVVDETGLTGKFDYSALTKLRGEDAAIDWAHQLGLELTEAVRPIEMLVVRRTQ
jgi:hypothetical protein